MDDTQRKIVKGVRVLIPIILIWSQVTQEPIHPKMKFSNKRAKRDKKKSCKSSYGVTLSNMPSFYLSLFGSCSVSIFVSGFGIRSSL